MSAVIGALLLFSWYHDRRIAALGWWSLCCLAAASASFLYMIDGATSDALGRQFANGFFLLAFGLSYGASRRFNGETMRWPFVVAGPAVWAATALIFDLEFFERLVIMSLLVGIYGFATARELWRGSSGDMPSQRAAAIVTAAHATYMLLRPLGGPGMQPGKGVPIEPTPGWMSVVGIVIILYGMIFGFLIMAMAKEKADLEHRRAALIDPLTGIANRRAFMAEAARLLASAIRGKRAAALVMFDLDHFKAVNDGHGHMVGDQTLVEFCATVGAHLPQRSTFGRLGGEEFAIFVDGHDHVRAVELAETIRLDLEQRAQTILGRPVAATVSAGVAASLGERSTLASLLAASDSALYRAKAQGRNRVVAEIFSVDLAGRTAAAKAMVAA